MPSWKGRAPHATKATLSHRSKTPCSRDLHCFSSNMKIELEWASEGSLLHSSIGNN